MKLKIYFKTKQPVNLEAINIILDHRSKLSFDIFKKKFSNLTHLHYVMLTNRVGCALVEIEGKSYSQEFITSMIEALYSNGIIGEVFTRWVVDLCLEVIEYRGTFLEDKEPEYLSRQILKTFKIKLESLKPKFKKKDIDTHFEEWKTGKEKEEFLNLVLNTKKLPFYYHTKPCLISEASIYVDNNEKKFKTVEEYNNLSKRFVV